LALRRIRLPAAAALVAIGYAIPGLTHISGRMNNAFALALLPAALIAYSLGSTLPPLPAVAGLALVAAGTLVAVGANVMLPILTAGPFAGGMAVRSRRRAAGELAQRGLELQREEERFAAESVRLERARIARELHDIVAHCVSLIVVQAGAGQRLVARDPGAAAAAFDSIAEAARQAEGEIDRLVAMLADRDPQAAVLGLPMIQDLVAQATAAGLAVSCRVTGAVDVLSPDRADAAFRVVQEGLTNALKHAPGADVAVDIAADHDGVEVRVVNGPARLGGPGLASSGGGHGLAGMRERAARCGGSINAGPAPQGGWVVALRLPYRHG
ncbi:MAG TPA: histidine kinase, partial [Actinomycetota bacterium]|nr:histidine kinase [Actinomycetota bacterium]